MYRDEVSIDGFDAPLTIRASVAVWGSDLLVDYAGTSPQVDRGINVVFNYTHAYTTYPLICAIGPTVPNNEGSFRPVAVKAPEGSILNCTFSGRGGRAPSGGPLSLAGHIWGAGPSSAGARHRRWFGRVVEQPV